MNYADPIGNVLLSYANKHYIAELRDQQGNMQAKLEHRNALQLAIILSNSWPLKPDHLAYLSFELSKLAVYAEHGLQAEYKQDQPCRLMLDDAYYSSAGYEEF